MELDGFRATCERLANGTVVISVAGELDLYTAPELERALLAADGAGSVVVELSRCTFLDSTALALLIEANRRASDANGGLRIVAAGPAVRRPFEVSGLDRLFAFYPTRTAALNGESR